MGKKLSRIKTIILDALFPPLCISCRKHLSSKREKSINLCKSCEELIKFNPSIDSINIENKHYYILSAGSYQNKIVRDIIHAFKYRKIRSAASTIEEKLISPLIKESKEVFQNRYWNIIPVPLHKIKERKRGFNQSSLIAKSLRNQLKKHNIESKIEEKIILKQKNTKSQAKLKGSERKNNIKGSFKIRDANKLNKKNVIIIDDVYTTGSTIKECINKIKKSNPKEIVVITAAKT